MADRVGRACIVPGCPELADAIGARCKAHRVAANQSVDRKASKAFLDSKPWDRARETKLRTNPFCEECVKVGRYVLGQHIHHVIPRAIAPHLSLDQSNLCTLCHSCHSSITLRETRAGQV